MGEGLLSIPQGETFVQIFEYYDSDDELVDLTGWTARMQIRTSRDATGDPVVSLTTENGGIALGGAAGTITITIDNSVTDTLTIRTGRYDLELVQPSGEPIRVVEDKVVVRRQVTR